MSEVSFPHAPATAQPAPGLPPIQTAWLGPSTSASATSSGSGAAVVTAFPGTPTDGQQVILTDSLTVPTWYRPYQYNLAAAKWMRLSDWQFDYAQITAPPTAVTATTEGTSVAQITGNSVTYDGSRVKVEVFIPGVTNNGSGIATFVLYRDTTPLGQYRDVTATLTQIGHKIELFDTPAAGAHTYKLAAFIQSGTSIQVQAGAGGSGAVLPAWLRTMTG